MKRIEFMPTIFALRHSPGTMIGLTKLNLAEPSLIQGVDLSALDLIFGIGKKFVIA